MDDYEIPDGCDRCGPHVRAFVWVTIGDKYLSYCGSCGTRYMARLLEVGKVTDYRHLIEP